MPTDRWGNATWILFHTIAAQISYNNFEKYKDLLVEVIVTTCNNLPCPTCKDHASNIIKQAKTVNIKKKSDFIEFLRQFHNIVNIKLEKKTYSKEEIDKKYNNLDLVKIMKNFITVFSLPSRNMKMLRHSFHQQNFVKNIKPKLEYIVVNCNRS